MIPYLVETPRVRLRRLGPEDAAVFPFPAEWLSSYGRHPLHDRVPYALAFCRAGGDRALGWTALVPTEDDDFRLELHPEEGAREPGREAALLFARWMPQRFGIRAVRPPATLSADGSAWDCRFLPPAESCLSDGVVTLERTRLDEPDVERGYVGTAFFDILAGNARVGSCSLRCGYNENLFWNGHISYTVFPAFRGHGFASHAARLLADCAGRCGMPQVSICCLPGNAASRRTAQNCGAVPEGTFPIPPQHPLYAPARTCVCRYIIRPQS